MIRPSRRLLVAPLLCASLSLPPAGAAAESGTASDSVFDLSIEQLVSLEVISASRKAERLDEVASAVHVISHDDIKRSGARRLAEALRLAPGLAVLEIDGSQWAVGARGSVGRLANKLLVMIDGRVVYTPSFSGVFWDVQDTNMEDVDRIEVVRGPGATTWGTNAVNGVVNVITRRASEDPGASVYGRTQTDGGYEAGWRVASQLAPDWDYRLFVKHAYEGSGEQQGGAPMDDDWRISRAGIRLDGTPSSRDAVTVVSEVYDGRSDEVLTIANPLPPFGYLPTQTRNDLWGAFINSRWVRTTDSGHRSELQVVGERTHRNALQVRETRTTLAVDVQHQRDLGPFDLVMGAGHRRSEFVMRGGATIDIANPLPDVASTSAFVQAETRLLGERMRLTAGSKFERQSLSDRDVEFMPTVRALWQFTPATNAWGAITRAVRTPSLVDQFGSATDVVPALPPGAPGNPFPVTMRVNATGDAAFGSERAWVRELGLRSRATESFAWSVAVFDARYTSLRDTTQQVPRCAPSGVLLAVEPSCLFFATSVVVDMTLGNSGGGHLRGGELTVDWAPTPSLRLQGSWSLVREDLRALIAVDRGIYPQQQALLRAGWRIRDGLDVELTTRYVDQIALMALGDNLRADLALNWRLSPRIELQLGGRNLLGSGDVAFRSELGDLMSRQVEPVGFARLRWQY